MPRTPPSKELPSLSASTIDTLFSFPRKLPIAIPVELPVAFPREPPLMPELPVTSPEKLPAQHWSIPTFPEKPPVPTKKPPALIREAQIRELTSAPTREPTALVDLGKLADLKINHIESINSLQISHKGVLEVNHKGVQWNPNGNPNSPQSKHQRSPKRINNSPIRCQANKGAS
jgi:hypothetical protein